MSTIQALGDYVIVEHLEVKDKTDGGIYLPSASQNHVTGVIKSVGPGAPQAYGMSTLGAKPGDKVLLINGNGHKIEHAGKSVYLYKFSSVVALLDAK